MNREMITTQQTETLRALCRLVDDGGKSPSLKEWAAEAGVSYQTICRHKRRLLDCELIAFDPHSYRSTRPTPLGRSFLIHEDGDKPAA